MKNIYLKYTLLSVAITSSLLFTACGHKHTFADATCTTPKTCNECGEIEGEALGHTWVEATCENPKTCSICNLTEGNPLEHLWLEATTEAPKTCESCGLTEGEPLPTPASENTESTTEEKSDAAEKLNNLNEEQAEMMKELLTELLESKGITPGSGGQPQHIPADPAALADLGGTYGTGECTDPDYVHGSGDYTGLEGDVQFE